jgi:hypothetical protein
MPQAIGSISVGQSRQDEPATRRLDGPARHHSEENVDPWPALARQTCIVPVAFHTRGEEGAVQIALSRDPTGAAMPTLGRRLLDDRPTVTGLAQPGGPGRELVDPTAGTPCLAAQVLNEAARRTTPGRFAISTLKGAVAELLKSRAYPEPNHLGRRSAMRI